MGRECFEGKELEELVELFLWKFLEHLQTIRLQEFLELPSSRLHQSLRLQKLGLWQVAKLVELPLPNPEGQELRQVETC
jgi:hypothetical protein